ncbi:major facilitator superfamily domain-containing protein [Astrocystis sublimbata]|nr:major facilitator superfamily domain-containing protein [Astrocystis sublimbata]
MDQDIEKTNGRVSPPMPMQVQSSGPPPLPDDDAEQRFQPKTLKFWSVIISIFLALFLVALDRTIIGTATPQITQEFHSLGDIGWYGSAYQLTTAASQLLFGRVYKFYDIKWTFLISVVVFEVGSVLCGAAPNSIVFIVGRAIAGIGGAGIFSGVTIIMVTMVPLRKRPMFQGLFGTIFGLASVLGPLVGGALTDAATWRWCFYINLPIGAVAAASIIFVLKPSRHPHPPASAWEQIRRLDPLGTFFFVPSIVSLLIALQWGGSTYAWGNWRIIVLFVLFGVLLFAFIAVQVFMPKTATVPVRIIRKRSILAATIFMFALAGSFLMAIYYLPLWFQVVQGVSATQSGVYTLPFVLSLVVASISSGAFTQKVGYYVPAMIASPSLLATGQGLMSTFRVNESSSHWIGYQVIAGFGLGLGLQASSLAAQAVLPTPDVPIGIAIMFFAQQLGGGIFSSVGQNLLSTYLVSHLHITGLTADQITNQGVTELLMSVAPKDRAMVKAVYNQAISQIFRCAMGVALGAVAAAIFMEWKNVKKVGLPRGTAPSAQAGAKAPSPDDAASEGSGGLFVDSSRKLSSDTHSNPERRDETAIANGATDDTDATPPPVPPPRKRGCDHCEHCQLSRELTRPFSGSNNNTNTTAHNLIGRHSYESAPARPSRISIPQNGSRGRGRRPSAASAPTPDLPLIPSPHPHRPRREPSTQELVETARRVSAQLERDDQHEQEQTRRSESEEMEARRRLDRHRQHSRQLSRTASLEPVSPQSPLYLPRGMRHVN